MHMHEIHKTNEQSNQLEQSTFNILKSEVDKLRSAIDTVKQNRRDKDLFQVGAKLADNLVQHITKAHNDYLLDDLGISQGVYFPTQAELKLLKADIESLLERRSQYTQLEDSLIQLDSWIEELN